MTSWRQEIKGRFRYALTVIITAAAVRWSSSTLPWLCSLPSPPDTPPPRSAFQPSTTEVLLRFLLRVACLVDDTCFLFSTLRWYGKNAHVVAIPPRRWNEILIWAHGQVQRRSQWNICGSKIWRKSKMRDRPSAGTSFVTTTIHAICKMGIPVLKDSPLYKILCFSSNCPND